VVGPAIEPGYSSLGYSSRIKLRTAVYSGAAEIWRVIRQGRPFERRCPLPPGGRDWANRACPILGDPRTDGEAVPARPQVVQILRLVPRRSAGETESTLRRRSSGTIETAGVDVNLPLRIATLRLNWADSAPTGVASERTGVRAKAAIPLRARNLLHPPKNAFIRGQKRLGDFHAQAQLRERPQGIEFRSNAPRGRARLMHLKGFVSTIASSEMARPISAGRARRVRTTTSEVTVRAIKQFFYVLGRKQASRHI
jgi:hypothetical protein